MSFKAGFQKEDFVGNTLGIDVSAEKKTLLSAIWVLQDYTHVNAHSFKTPKNKANKNAAQAISALTQVLDLAEQCRKTLLDALQSKIDSEVVDAAIGETIGSIDELASHYSLNDVDVEEYEVVKVDSKSLSLRAHGNVGVDLQWGSNSDVSKGDGLVIEQYFPFTCELESSVDDPLEVSVIEYGLHVDTSSMRERLDGDA